MAETSDDADQRKASESVNPEARKYLTEQMEKFFSNADVETAEGYVPPSKS